MPAKIFTFNDVNLRIEDPAGLNFENAFYQTVYQKLFDEITADNLNPQVDFDRFHDFSIGFDIYALAQDNRVRVNKPSTPCPENYRVNAMLAFLIKFPYFYNFLQNINALAAVSIAASEWVFGASVCADNFIDIKKVIDDWNKLRWSRNKTNSESQAGVTNLGTISENLLEKALESFIDNDNFFKNNTSEVQSYGDFVLMCLPNNLWLSVKSNYARERLLASGYTTDILGVGFFTDSTEFTSGAKIRNFQKVGFLAMYVPDIPITEDQINNNTSTYSEIKSFYEAHQQHNFPLNINGQPFVRKLSQISDDIGRLLEETNIKRRTTIGF